MKTKHTQATATTRETKRELRTINTQLRAHDRAYQKTQHAAARATERITQQAIRAYNQVTQQETRDLRALDRAATKLKRRRGILQGRLQ